MDATTEKRRTMTNPIRRSHRQPKPAWSRPGLPRGRSAEPEHVALAQPPQSRHDSPPTIRTQRLAFKRYETRLKKVANSRPTTKIQPWAHWKLTSPNEWTRPNHSRST